ncbi:GNAT family protein [Paractinoplanes ferrugineus]|uniref:N-acetyltransferase n=1 Tax=Paractinoplanes ferrugineus TaxID=113564 RepID=A0A919JAC3_9ACTN|nr:GNAT family protein [Actinoplanes ferrugineus]GIE15988.1 N-acetyltransferase [Actinoplanes ferrugineus]
MDDVRLRPIEFSDWRAVHGWAKLIDSCRYQGWGPNTEAETESYVRESAALWHSLPQTSFPQAVLAGSTVIGIADLHLRGSAQAEIGYGIHPARWGRGAATAAARELLRQAFTEHNLHRVYATCDPRNAGSARVLTKIGMTYEGRMRETVLIRDGWRDSDLHAILEQEWRAREGVPAQGSARV